MAVPPAMYGHFKVFVTIDANLEYRQNLLGLSFGIVGSHAKSNRLADIEPMRAELADAVDLVGLGEFVHVPRRVNRSPVLTVSNPRFKRVRCVIPKEALGPESRTEILPLWTTG